MIENKNKDLPWQNYPKKFIRYASNFENTKDDFERLIGYLLLDVGVEALLKAYVLADSSLKYEKREASAKGMVGKDTISDSKITAANFDKITFHNLIETVKLIARSKVTDAELKHAEHYHGIRNIIYHEGRKTVPSVQDFKNYLALAKSLLQKLLAVEHQGQGMKAINEFEYLDLLISGNVFSDLQHDIAVAIVLIHANYETRSFKQSLWEIGREVDALSSMPLNSSSYQIVETELIKRFNELTGTKIADIDFILKACFDISYLQLATLLSKMQEDVFGELEKYVRFRDFSKKPIPNIDEITQGYKDNLDSYNDWVSNMREKINSWFEENISKIKITF